MNNIKLLYIDLFCGAGGTSTGVLHAVVNGEKCAKVIACVNHDANAIASHAANHPDALHFTEDIRTLDLTELVKHTNRSRWMNPGAKVVLWASLECTNFSKAKGGQPRDADSRTLAEHLFRYIEALNPDYIQIENVEEFMCWGELDENGHPVSRYKGTSYMRWVKNVCAYGYNFDFRLLNSADYGAYTSRKRFFGQFARHGLPIAFPKATHAKQIETSSEHSLFPEEDSLEQWKPVREVLDLDDEGESIFGRKKPLVEKTLERIYAGLIKFVAGGKEEFLIKWNSVNGKTGKYVPPSIDDPCPTVACQNRLGMAKVQFLSKQFGGTPSGKNISIEEPAGTVTCRDHHAFISVHYGNGYNSPIDAPAPTVTCKDRFGLVTNKFIANYRFRNTGSSINEPAPTICTVGQIGVVNCKFLEMQYGNGTPASADEPAPTVTTNPKHKLVSVKPWVMNTNFSNVGSSIDEPSPTITANRKWHYLMNPQFACKGGSIDQPCFTLIARMDKMPPSLVSTQDAYDTDCSVDKLPDFIHFTDHGIVYEIYDTDSEIMKKIKEFMALYAIADITMRMLNIPELKRIMGFPEDYVLLGTQAEQKKFIGNAVEVNMARVLCEALYIKLAKVETIAM